jgi:hypothetical protein
VHFFDHLFCVPLGWGVAVCLLDIKIYDGKKYVGLSLRERPFNSEWWGLAKFVGSEYLFSTFNSPDRKDIYFTHKVQHRCFVFSVILRSAFIIYFLWNNGYNFYLQTFRARIFI